MTDLKIRNFITNSRSAKLKDSDTAITIFTFAKGLFNQDLKAFAANFKKLYGEEKFTEFVQALREQFLTAEELAAPKPQIPTTVWNRICQAITKSNSEKAEVFTAEELSDIELATLACATIVWDLIEPNIPEAADETEVWEKQFEGIVLTIMQEEDEAEAIIKAAAEAAEALKAQQVATPTPTAPAKPAARPAGKPAAQAPAEQIPTAEQQENGVVAHQSAVSHEEQIQAALQTNQRILSTAAKINQAQQLLAEAGQENLEALKGSSVTLLSQLPATAE